MRFVQFADTHLGPGKMNGDLCSAFARACTLAVDRKADIVLIPGDVFDYEEVDHDIAAFVIQTLQSIAPIPVFIAPGNHDSLRPRSPYSDENWPSNVHIFTSPEFETVTLNALGCSDHRHRARAPGDHGSCCCQTGSKRPLAPIRLLLFHGSRDGFPSEKETVIPFSDAELLAQGFTYAAIGHYHSFGPINDARSCVRAAYSGCPQGRGLDETGEKCVLVGEIDPEGRVQLEAVEVAERRIVRVDVDVTGLRDQAEIFARVDGSLSGLAREQDVVYVFLKRHAATGHGNRRVSLAVPSALP